MKLRKLSLEQSEPTEENVGHNTPHLLERSLIFLSTLTDTLAQTLLGLTRYILMLAITPKSRNAADMSGLRMQKYRHPSKWAEDQGEVCFLCKERLKSNWNEHEKLITLQDLTRFSE